MTRPCWPAASAAARSEPVPEWRSRAGARACFRDRGAAVHVHVTRLRSGRLPPRLRSDRAAPPGRRQPNAAPRCRRRRARQRRRARKREAPSRSARIVTLALPPPLASIGAIPSATYASTRRRPSLWLSSAATASAARPSSLSLTPQTIVPRIRCRPPVAVGTSRVATRASRPPLGEHPISTASFRTAVGPDGAVAPWRYRGAEVTIAARRSATCSTSERSPQ